VVAKAVNEIMAKPKKIEFEKVYSTMLLLSKKRYAGIKFTDDHVFGKTPPVELKGVQSVRRDGCALVRELVGECLTSILGSGDITDAASLARRRLLDVVEDKIPLSKYAISKTLRKNIQDCSLPHSQQELREIRTRIGSTNVESEDQLSYAEQDECIHKKVKIIWKSRVKLPHVCLAWKLRLEDPGSAPVLGESINFIVTVNATKQIADKVETLEKVEKSPGIVVDRAYYLKSLETPIDNLFAPVFLQRLLASRGRIKPIKQDEDDAKKEVKNMIWIAIVGRPLTQEKAKRAASIAASPIAMAFKKQKAL
jgi:DNA polymerase elongation subunit (family B)